LTIAHHAASLSSRLTRACAVFAVPVIDDTLANEGGETVLLLLSRPSGARLGPANQTTLTIIENDID